MCLSSGVARVWRMLCEHVVKVSRLERFLFIEKETMLIYEKLPNDISERHVLLLDPILGTGNSAVQAISLILEKGVPESNIIFLNLISAPQGVHMVCKRFPRIKIVTSEIETGLNEDFRVVPGMGNFLRK